MSSKIKRAYSEWVFCDIVENRRMTWRSSKIAFPILAGWEGICNFVADLICRWKGHKLQDNSCCGPDAGNIEMDCVRCGRSWHTQLY